MVTEFGTPNMTLETGMSFDSCSIQLQMLNQKDSLHFYQITLKDLSPCGALGCDKFTTE